MASFFVDVVEPTKGCVVTRNDTGQTMNFPMLRVDFAPEASATEHPVETGVTISDHIQIRPAHFTVEAYVTESPLGVALVPLAQASAIAFLKGCLGQLLTVIIDGEGTFFNMVLEGFPHSRTAVEGRPISLRFKEIRIATALSVQIPPGVPAPVAAAGAPTELDLGQQSTTAGLPVSALKDIKDATSTLSPVAFVASLLGF